MGANISKRMVLSKFLFKFSLIFPYSIAFPCSLFLSDLVVNGEMTRHLVSSGFNFEVNRCSLKSYLDL